MDPLTALAALRAAYSGIQYCCEALSEGKAQVQKIKKAADDAKAIVGEVRGIWATIKSLFVSAAPAAAPKPDAPKKAKEKYTTHVPTEDEIVQQFVKHLGEYFQQDKALREYAERRFEEVFAADDPNPVDILELTTIQAEIEQSYLRLSEMMTVRAPAQLGPLWTNFNSMHGRVTAEQQKRKERARIQAAQERWQREEAHHLLIDRLTTVAAVAFVLVWTWGMLLSLGWQEMIWRGSA